MPGGRTLASVSRSYSQAAVRSPRLVPIAWWTGTSTWSSTNTTPTAASGPARSRPPWTAPTSAPVATANTAGSTPRHPSTTHQATARPGSALNRAPKKRHSWRSRRAWIDMGGSAYRRLPTDQEPAAPRGRPS